MDAAGLRGIHPHEILSNIVVLSLNVGAEFLGFELGDE